MFQSSSRHTGPNPERPAAAPREVPWDLHLPAIARAAAGARALGEGELATLGDTAVRAAERAHVLERRWCAMTRRGPWPDGTPEAVDLVVRRAVIVTRRIELDAELFDPGGARGLAAAALLGLLHPTVACLRAVPPPPERAAQAVGDVLEHLGGPAAPEVALLSLGPALRRLSDAYASLVALVAATRRLRAALDDASECASAALETFARRSAARFAGSARRDEQGRALVLDVLTTRGRIHREAGQPNDPRGALPTSVGPPSPAPIAGVLRPARHLAAGVGG